MRSKSMCDCPPAPCPVRIRRGLHRSPNTPSGVHLHRQPTGLHVSPFVLCQPKRPSHRVKHEWQNGTAFEDVFVVVTLPSNTHSFPPTVPFSPRWRFSAQHSANKFRIPFGQEELSNHSPQLGWMSHLWAQPLLHEGAFSDRTTAVLFAPPAGTPVVPWLAHTPSAPTCLIEHTPTAMWELVAP